MSQQGGMGGDNKPHLAPCAECAGRGTWPGGRPFHNRGCSHDDMRHPAPAAPASDLNPAARAVNRLAQLGVPDHALAPVKLWLEEHP